MPRLFLSSQQTERPITKEVGVSFHRPKHPVHIAAGRGGGVSDDQLGGRHDQPSGVGPLWNVRAAAVVRL